MVGTDSNMLSLFLYPEAKPPRDPVTGKPIARLPDRIQHLLDTLNTDNETIIIPAPVLAEFLILVDQDGPEYLATIKTLKTMRVEPFDERAAIELATMELAARKLGDKRGGLKSPWQKVKVDRQIVAIAKIHGATRIYSDDPDVKNIAAKVGIAVTHTWELPLPPSKTPLFEDIPEIEEPPKK